MLRFKSFCPALILLVCTAFNLWQALTLELAHDEAYYWMFSRHLDWGYFDHPPMTAWWIYLGHWIEGELGVRLLSILSWTVGSILLTSLAVGMNRTWAYAWWFIVPLSSFCGFLAVPDTPLVFFTILYLLALKRYYESDDLISILSMGLVSAALFYSKYHGVFLIVATVLADISLLKRKSFWLSAVLATLLFVPHLHWQWQHHFPTLKYHFFQRPNYTFAWWRVGEYLGAQLACAGLLLGPWAWWKFIRYHSPTKFDRSLKCMAIFTVIFFFISVFSKKVEGNWTVAAYVPMTLFLWRRNLLATDAKLAKFLLGASFVIMLAARIVFMYPQGSPPKPSRTNEFHGWRKWTQQLAKDHPDCHWTANSYQIASKMSFYLNQEIPSLNVKARLNQFELWQLQTSLLGQKVCYLRDRSFWPGENLKTPEGRELVLVKDILLDDILSLKAENSWPNGK